MFDIQTNQLEDFLQGCHLCVNRFRMHYQYDSWGRTLGILQSTDSLGNFMQDIDYTFDNASNVTGIVNTAGVINTLGGTYTNDYDYDVLHRLVDSYGNGAAGNYSTAFSYSPSGRLIEKYRDNSSATLSASANIVYGYCDDYQPHAVKRMFDYNSGMLYDMRWDEEKSSGLFDSVAENKSAGNLGQVSMAMSCEMVEASRFLFWTEDSAVQSERRTNSFVIPSQNSVGVANWMHTAVDDRYYSYYTYDHSGERRLKLTGENDLLDVNVEYMSTISALDKPTLYPSAYMVLTNRGYTNVAKVESRASLLALPRRSNVTERKHYYAGAERVAARLGGGGLNDINQTIGNDDALQAVAGILFGQCLKQANDRVLQRNDLDCIGQNDFAKDEFCQEIYDIPSKIKAQVKLSYRQFKDMMNDMLVDHGQGSEPDVYFYHSDHLGSASWITDNNGNAVQHLQYLPYGEPYINQRLTGYHERFTFTGKGPRQGWRTPLSNIIYSEQRDEETGYGYFGARYMDHELMTMWLSVDPMADKYPSISPYAYCAWNPVKLVDPDGKEFDPYMQKYASILRNYCKRQIAKLEKMKTLTDKQSEQLNGYRNTISEMDKLEKDPSTLFCFGKHTNNKSNEEILGFTTYGGEKGGKVTFNITLREDSFLENDNLNMKGLGAFAHELKHAYQYYSGESAFAINKDGVCIMYNHEDLEIPAYNRGTIVCGLNAQQTKILNPKVFSSLKNENYSNLSEFETYFRGKNYQIIKH